KAGLIWQWGALDFAGGTVVHINAGVAGLVGSYVLGKRIGFGREQLTPHNLTMTMVGASLLWFGWFGFNSGSALAANELAVLAFINTNTASAAAMLAWMFYDAVRGRRPSALGAAIGAVVGLVAITPACGFVTVGQSIVIGIAASIISNLVAHWRSKSQLDDTLDVFPCHGVGGIVGMIATGLFAEKVGLIHGDPTLFIRHLLAIVIVGAYSFGGSYILYKLTDFLVSLRVRPEQEEAGLDISQHAESY
ncbi:MAG: ammonium transporter, partial [bacterium]|nr:ammonium transporter [bacterium]